MLGYADYGGFPAAPFIGCGLKLGLP